MAKGIFVVIAMWAMMAECLAHIRKYDQISTFEIFGFTIFCTASRDVPCNAAYKASQCCFSVLTCNVNQTIGSAVYMFKMEPKPAISQLYISSNEKTKFLPMNTGVKLPNLKEFHAEDCALTFIDNMYFKNMGNLKHLYLQDNAIGTIDADAFKDLVKLELLNLDNNQLETLDVKIFSTMVELRTLNLLNNSLRVLRPATFVIPNGHLEKVFLKDNGCIDENYVNDPKSTKSFAKLKKALTAECAP